MSKFTVIYEFDRFRLDRKNQRLTRDGLLVTMSGKSLSILAALIEHREKVLSTEKMVNAFFPRSLQAEEDLTGEILTIKRLLDDTSSTVPMVRTIAGKGYQFDAEVHEYLGDSASDQQFGSGSSGSSSSSSGGGEPDPKPSKRRRSGTKIGPVIGIAMGAILVIAIGLGIWKFLPKSRSSGGGSGNSQVAVLPFQSLTGSASDDSFNHVLTEALIESLGKRNLQVVPETSVQRYIANGAVDPVAAGYELGAQVIVRGMAQRLAGRILVKVQLISTRDGSQIWSNGFEGDSNDVAGLSAKISEKIFKGLPSANGSEQP